MMQKKHGWWKVAALAALCAVPALVAGCNGGNGGLIGGGGVQQTGTFAGTGTLGAGRAGTFSLKTFNNNTVNGSVNVTAVAPVVVNKGTSTLPVVVLPTGLYSFTGTINGSTFTGSGTIPNSTSTFNINGTLSTSTTAGSFTLAGTLNGETFSFNGTITTTTGGGGGGGTGDANFTFSSNSSNANTATFSSIAGAGTSLLLPGQSVFLLSGSFASATNATNLRTVTVTLVDSSFAEGDTFTLSDEDTPGNGNATVVYTEGAPANKAWISHSGQIKITAKDGNKLTLQVTQAHMEPSDLAGPGQTNQATGEFDLSGTGKLNATGLGL